MLAELLGDCTSVTELDLTTYAPGVGAVGAAALGEALSRNTSVRRLRLTGSELADGAARFAAAIMRNDTLESLVVESFELPVQKLKGGRFDPSDAADEAEAEAEGEGAGGGKAAAAAAAAGGGGGGKRTLLARAASMGKSMGTMVRRMSRTSQGGGGSGGGGGGGGSGGGGGDPAGRRESEASALWNDDSNRWNDDVAGEEAGACSDDSDGSGWDDATATRLSLRGKGLGRVDLVMLLALVGVNRVCKRLDLSGNPGAASVEAGVALGELLRRNRTLTSLRLSETLRIKGRLVSGGGAAQDERAAVDRKKGGGDKPRSEQAEAFARCPRSRPTTLPLVSANGLQEEAALALGESLSMNVGLVELTVGRAKLPLPDLRGTTGKRIIDLSRAGLGAEDGGIIGRLIASNRTLTSLDLSWKAAPARFFHAIGNGLVSNAALISLNLAYNCVGAAAARIIADGLRVNAALKRST